ncbi:hypothetical protein [Corynebacterium cystitidis]|uniref:Uncharacterized protein n=1 Tax=Corynebacterium cystitidis DSM 20524 TaxID=1121357 RepID=A0A1H9TAP6_9CORY|nr:hypothetical protein [Corynebacterium cystitidis]WJY83537.1 hypothetical protein CCYS_13265 [Corynebacterium cystitidis DSM 20524]SER94380.1 hypothetical protein SAMN05661109_01393 [Corynebacterium cystitidis DSM 20524]SNV92229.1 Uncharacterised protein [Corynebacterium cystitidis]
MNPLFAIGLTGLLGAAATFTVLVLVGVANPWPATILVGAIVILLGYWQFRKFKKDSHDVRRDSTN